MSAQQPIPNLPDARFISGHHLPRLSRALGGRKAGGAAPTGLDSALQELADRFGDPRFLARNYIQPHCQRAQPAEAPNPDKQDSASVERQPLFAVIDEFISGKQSRLPMFVLGDTGMGKTSLLVMLKLMHLTALWPKHVRCELLKLGDETGAQIGKIKAPRKTVLLLDALNEDRAAATNFHAQVADLMQATSAFHRVIITCRTRYHPDGRPDRSSPVARLASAGFGCPTIFLSRFNDPQVDKYLKRRFRRMEEPTRKRAKIVLNGMGSLKSRPLLLSVFDDFVHSRCKVWNEFSIYEMMVNAWLDREQRKSGRGEALDRELLLDTCVRIARLVTLAGRRNCLSPAELKSAQLPAPESAQLANLDCRGDSFLLRDSNGNYRFSHTSLQEFLIALGLHRGVLSSGKKRVPATSLMIIFLLQGSGSDIAWSVLDLSGASLAGARFEGSDFSRSLLVSAELAETVFSKTTFDNADLRLCEARGSKFVNCSFKASNAASARAVSALFEGCQLSQATFAGSALAGANFGGCHIENTSFADVDLSGSVFHKCKLEHCNFTAASLSGAQFRDCTLDGVKFDRCSLDAATFTGPAPTDISLNAADLRGAALDESYLGALASGAAKHWQDAAWDPEIAKRLRFSREKNAQNAAAIDSDAMR